jgi:cytochrome c553
MYAHFDRTREVHDALIERKPAAVRSGANWLATHPDPGHLPHGSASLGKAMAVEAAYVRDAADLHEAARATARMAAACGDCHSTYGVDSRFMTGAPPTGSGVEAQMALHYWVSEEMWRGLAGPDDYAWNSGAQALTEGWLSPREVVADPASRVEGQVLLRELYETGARAKDTTNPHERAELYGDLLDTCIDCHEMTGAIIGQLAERVR